MVQYQLNHYVVLDGLVAEEALDVLNQWLGGMNAQRLTDRVWVYLAGTGAEESMLRSRNILERLGGLSPGPDWEPFRVLFLGPKGNGCFGYRMPSISTSGDGRMGASGWSI